MKKFSLLSILLLIAMLSSLILLAIPASAETVDRSDWTAIASAADFAKIVGGSSSAPKKYYLTKDITLTSTLTPNWNGKLENFILDGDGHTITLSKGMFNALNNVTVKNLVIEGKMVWTSTPFNKSPISTGNCDNMGKVTLENITSNVDIEVLFNNRYKRLSGVIHYVRKDSVIKNVKYTGDILVKGDDQGDKKIQYVGGIVGYAEDTLIENCVNEGSITIEALVNPGKDNNGSLLKGYVGGIVGYLPGASSKLKGCTNSGDISVLSDSDQYTCGGIVGASAALAEISDCKNSGTLTFKNCTSGIAGCESIYKNMTGCTNTGTINTQLIEVPATQGDCFTPAGVHHFQCPKCSICYDENGKKLSDSELFTEASHAYGELISEKSASCTENGMAAHYKCSACNEYFDQNKAPTVEFFLVQNATGHALTELIPRSEPTAESDGMEAHYECAHCHQYFDSSSSPVSKESLTIAKLSSESDTNTGEDEPTPSEPTKLSSGCASALSSTALLATVALLLATPYATKKKRSL